MVCALFLSVQVGVYQNAVGAELNAGNLLGPSLGHTFDSKLLQDYFKFNLDLERQNTQKMMSRGVKIEGQKMAWKLPLVTKDGRALPFIQESVQRTVRLETLFQRSMMEAVRTKNKNVSLDELGVILPSAFAIDFLIEDTQRTIQSPLPRHIQLPPVAQPPIHSSLPSPLSLLMLMVGGLVLLGWSRGKRNHQRVIG